MVILLLAVIFLEEEFMQDLLGGHSDRLGAPPEVIEAA